MIAETNGTGIALYQNTYDIDGNPGTTNAGRFGYAGYQWLYQADIWHLRNRGYQPRLARFMQTDPIGQAGGLNLYGYVGGDPVNYVDPWGLVQIHSQAGCYTTYRQDWTTSSTKGDAPRRGSHYWTIVTPGCMENLFRTDEWMDRVGVRGDQRSQEECVGVAWYVSFSSSVIVDDMGYIANDGIAYNPWTGDWGTFGSGASSGGGLPNWSDVTGVLFESGINIGIARSVESLASLTEIESYDLIFLSAAAGYDSNGNLALVEISPLGAGGGYARTMQQGGNRFTGNTFGSCRDNGQ